MESFLDNFMKHRDTPIVSEKTPTNVLVFEEMLDVFPHARFLCIVRDPRDVVASLMKVGERAKKQGETPKEITIDLEAAIRHVRSCLDAGFRALDLAPERVGLVQYERLVREPARTTKAVCEFLSIPWSEAMLHPEQKRHPGEDAILNDVWYDRNSYYSAPDPDRIGRWKKRLSPSQKVAVNRAFSSDERLSKLGYALSADRLRIRDRVIGGIGHFTRRVIDEGRRRIRV